MSSTSKTAHLSLNQWAASDGVCREDFNADNAAVDAAVGAIPLVKIREITTAAAAETVEIDLSDIDMDDYLELWLDIRLNHPYPQYIRCRLNNITSSVYQDSYVSSNTVGAWSNPYMKPGTGMHRFVNGGGILCAKPIVSGGCFVGASALAWENWTSITFFNSSGSYLFPAGGKIKIFGVKNI